ncbi:colanic acid biosynthesis glycosyltransferase WcaL [Sphingobacterium mizutaii]|uniref:Colanic acid biosynthesis glycosyltransferase WcaL n=2 Tax=Sphingobacterium mizutaii TaxID=1010 RepID=A0AAJ4XBS8_9SPHI|nr:glycosyltransferase family 4 protein [Sphingobacterium mizutaii]SDL05015.1 Glycosyltransferase involved in cell wall bisynthesis [Sphingobacterium mizutaii]SNV50720.1 colanic acid biosynthesis glycosyltransferase WcaL [Sphingobacterium mizutaii]
MDNNNKVKVLFLVQLPPPVHGASLMNTFIKTSALINNHFSTKHINISAANELADIGKLRKRKIFNFLGMYFKVLKELMVNRPNLVYLTISPTGAAFYKDAIFAQMVKLFKVKIVYHLHGQGIYKVINSSKNKYRIYKYVFKSADIIILSKMLLFDIIKVRDVSKNVFILPNGIPKSVITFPERNHNGSPKEIRILYLSNYIPAKGALLALKAFHSILMQSNKPVSFELFGGISNQAYFDSIKDYVRENKLEAHVSINSGIYGEEKIRKMETCDIFLFPSRFECFPLSIIEAMMCGLCIVSTAVGAIPELVLENNCGLLSKPEDLEELTSILSMIVENDDLREKYSKNSLKSFEDKYQMEAFENSLINIINKTQNATN